MLTILSYGRACGYPTLRMEIGVAYGIYPPYNGTNIIKSLNRLIKYGCVETQITNAGPQGEPTPLYSITPKGRAYLADSSS